MSGDSDGTHAMQVRILPYALKRNKQMTLGGITFRGAIEINKRCIIQFLTENGKSCTADICQKYKGEKEMPAVRKALNELKKEGKIKTDEHVHMWQGKFYELTAETLNK